MAQLAVNEIEANSLSDLADDQSIVMEILPEVDIGKLVALSELELSIKKRKKDLLEVALAHWSLGDWQPLTNLTFRAIEKRDDRAKLALLVAAAHHQLCNFDAADEFLECAEQWGCSRDLISKILIGGTYHRLASIEALKGNHQRAMEQFEKSVSPDESKSDLVQKIAQLRMSRVMSSSC